MEELIAKQVTEIDAISRAFINLKKKGSNPSRGAVESRLQALEKKWNTIEARHNEIVGLSTPAMQNINYFKEGMFELGEDIFLDERGKFLDILSEISAVNHTTPLNVSGQHDSPGTAPIRTQRRLPPIDLPHFSGKYSEWTSFKDLFSALVAQNPQLTDVERLHYLKSCLTGDAASTIKNIPITEDNYDRAWSRLSHHYDNKRSLIFSCLNNWFQLNQVTHESPAQLKKLRDGTAEAIETLEVLGRPVRHMDDIFCFITVQRLDAKTRLDWELSIGDSTDPITWEMLDRFLITRIQALERSESAKSPLVLADSSHAEKTPPQRKSQRIPPKTTVHTATRQKLNNCTFCFGEHFIAFCKKFQACDLDNRRQFITEKHLCFNCLGAHLLRDCRGKKTCNVCHKRHHSLLHQPAEPPSSSQPTSDTALSHEVKAFTIKASVSMPRLTRLATAKVRISTEHQRTLEVRALIDPCSEVSFITESVAQQLRLPRQSVFVPISGIGAVPCHTAKTQAAVILSPHFESTKTWRLNALILPRLTDYLPPPQTIKSCLSFLDGLRLADHLQSNEPINMIIGADVFTKIIEDGLRKSTDEETIAQATGLGWILTGALPVLQTSSNSVKQPLAATSLQCIVDQHLSTLLERFWQQEEVSKAESASLTAAEMECETHFMTTHKRDSSGRYILRLPIKSSLTELGNSKPSALSALLRTESRFKTQPQLKMQYVKFIDEYIALGHMKKSTSESLSSQVPVFYLPHHGVFKESGETAKLRVVFNDSVHLKDGSNINDCLLAGPKLQVDIFDIILQWRTHRYVFSADIVKMFRQIKIAPEDQPLQRILWRASTEDPISSFDLTTVTYGLVSSPYQSIRTLHQLVLDEGSRFPQASKVLKTNCYVDDILAGADTIADAKQLKGELTELLLAGGFPLSKWTTNCPQILSDIPKADLAPSQQRTWAQSEVFHMLGISWRLEDDAFYFRITKDTMQGAVTKRKALSLIAQLFDPLGWISPIVISFKIFMQTLWHAGIHWDEPLPPPLENKWNLLYDQLQYLHLLSVPRWTGFSQDIAFMELHGFCDASERAYAACLYLRSVNKAGKLTSILLAAKSKVSPLKQISLPRLELCGALLLVRLSKRVKELLLLDDATCHLWSDSTITLSWIRGHPTTWKTFVANRVSEIQTSLPEARWHHVASKDNPADIASRGASPQTIIESTLWLHGPSFLLNSASPWSSAGFQDFQEECPDRRNSPCLVSKQILTESELLYRFSSLEKLLRVTARCQQYIQALRYSKLTNKVSKQLELSPSQLIMTLKFWVSQVQQMYFQDELKCLSTDAALPRRSSLLKFNPFIDNEGLLRVGGRLRHSLLHPDEKNPMILPRDSQLSRLLVWDAHQRTLHGGTQLTLNHLRQRFWITRGRQLVKALISKCLKCWRLRTAPATQLMGDLPSKRVNRFRPFLHSGVDFAGPINLRLSKGRGTRSYKGYIAVFVCLSVRAVHLEVASGYTTEDFLNVFRRFTARRGICASLTSDCGTNFVGASKELKVLFDQALTQDSAIAHHLAKDGTEWCFNPPSAPHFGGIWEAAVKSVKFHLKRVIGDALLTFEEMSTLLSQIEACLNSRPLHPLSDDPTDLSALTPGHFLIGTPILNLPEPSITDLKTSRLSRWQQIRQMYEHFWNRWSTEYLHQLQHRGKWRTKMPEVKVGDLCLIRSNLHPPCKWPLARITDVYPGPDGLIRVVQLRTSTSTLTRPIAKISLLPLDDDDRSPESGEGGRDV